MEDQPLMGSGGRLQIPEVLLDALGHALDGTEVVKPDALFDKTPSEHPQVHPQQCHEARHFLAGPLPVLRREGEKTQVPDAFAYRFLENIFHGLHPSLVSLDSRPASLRRPAPVPVHNDRDVTWDAQSGLRGRNTLRFRGFFCAESS